GEAGVPGHRDADRVDPERLRIAADARRVGLEAILGHADDERRRRGRGTRERERRKNDEKDRHAREIPQDSGEHRDEEAARETSQTSRRPQGRDPRGNQGFPRAYSGGWIRTTDLRVMSPPL